MGSCVSKKHSVPHNNGIPDSFYFSRSKGKVLSIQSQSLKKISFASKFFYSADSAIGHLSSNRILILGGTSQGSLKPTATLLHLNSLTFTSLPNLPFGCKEGQIHEIGEWIYYLGALQLIGSLESPAPILRLSLKLNLWQDVKEPEKDSDKFKFSNLTRFGSCVIDGRIFIFGGQRISNNNALKSSKLVLSLSLEGGFVLKNEGKLPIKVIRPIVAGFLKEAVITGGVNPKTSMPNKSCYIASLKDKNLSIQSTEGINVNIEENYPPLCTKDFFMFYSYPNVVIRHKAKRKWAVFQIKSKGNSAAAGNRADVEKKKVHIPRINLQVLDQQREIENFEIKEKVIEHKGKNIEKAPIVEKQEVNEKDDKIIGGIQEIEERKVVNSVEEDKKNHPEIQVKGGISIRNEEYDEVIRKKHEKSQDPSESNILPRVDKAADNSQSLAPEIKPNPFQHPVKLLKKESSSEYSSSSDSPSLSSSNSSLLIKSPPAILFKINPTQSIYSKTSTPRVKLESESVVESHATQKQVPAVPKLNLKGSLPDVFTKPAAKLSAQKKVSSKQSSESERKMPKPEFAFKSAVPDESEILIEAPINPGIAVNSHEIPENPTKTQQFFNSDPTGSAENPSPNVELKNSHANIPESYINAPENPPSPEILNKLHEIIADPNKSPNASYLMPELSFLDINPNISQDIQLNPQKPPHSPLPLLKIPKRPSYPPPAKSANSSVFNIVLRPNLRNIIKTEIKTSKEPLKLTPKKQRPQNFKHLEKNSRSQANLDTYSSCSSSSKSEILIEDGEENNTEIKLLKSQSSSIKSQDFHSSSSESSDSDSSSRYSFKIVRPIRAKREKTISSVDSSDVSDTETDQSVIFSSSQCENFFNLLQNSLKIQHPLISPSPLNVSTIKHSLEISLEPRTYFLQKDLVEILTHIHEPIGKIALKEKEIWNIVLSSKLSPEVEELTVTQMLHALTRGLKYIILRKA